MNFGAVAQLAEATGLSPVQRGFEYHRRHQFGGCGVMVTLLLWEQE